MERDSQTKRHKIPQTKNPANCGALFSHLFELKQSATGPPQSPEEKSKIKEPAATYV
ncbi:MAG: hypothetical protein ACKVHG_10305 [Sphingomonadales bacterium]